MLRTKIFSIKQFFDNTLVSITNCRRKKEIDANEYYWNSDIANHWRTQYYHMRNKTREIKKKKTKSIKNKISSRQMGGGDDDKSLPPRLFYLPRKSFDALLLHARFSRRFLFVFISSITYLFVCISTRNTVVRSARETRKYHFRYSYYRRTSFSLRRRRTGKRTKTILIGRGEESNIIL